MANPRVPGEGTWPSTPEGASVPPRLLRQPERAPRCGTAGASPLSVETGPQPRRRLLLAPGVVAGTGLWGNSVPGPMANPGGWTVSADNDHRPTEERRLPCRRYLLTGERLRAVVATGGVRARAGTLERALPGRQPLRQVAEAVSGSTDASHRARRGPRGLPCLTPGSLCGYARARLPGCLAGQVARGRLQIGKAGGSRPGGPRTGAAHTRRGPVTR